MSGAIPPHPNTPSLRGAQLKHRDNFTFTLQFTYLFMCTVSTNGKLIKLNFPI
jgi:hypothetical protein